MVLPLLTHHCLGSGSTTLWKPSLASSMAPACASLSQRWLLSRVQFLGDRGPNSLNAQVSVQNSFIFFSRKVILPLCLPAYFPTFLLYYYVLMFKHRETDTRSLDLATFPVSNKAPSSSQLKWLGTYDSSKTRGSNLVYSLSPFLSSIPPSFLLSITPPLLLPLSIYIYLFVNGKCLFIVATDSTAIVSQPCLQN